MTTQLAMLSQNFAAFPTFLIEWRLLMIHHQFTTPYLSLELARIEPWRSFRRSQYRSKVIWSNSRMAQSGRKKYSTSPSFEVRSFPLNISLMKSTRFSLLANSNTASTYLSRFTTASLRPFQQVPKEWKILRSQNNCSQTVISTFVPL